MIGALAGSAPVLVFVLGHIFVGVALIAGSTSLLAIGVYPENFGAREVEIVDYVLSAWGIAAAWLLLSGRIAKRAI